ncbi:MAG: NAD-dependent epimerase/dehydratase family protein [Polyangiaceae bacterium]
MRVFVTGGSGFVGGHLIERLVERGHEVRALARSDRAAAVVRGYGAAPAQGDLGSVGTEALRGVDAVVHAAAFVEEWGTRAQFWEANVEGTSRLLEAARSAGVKRFVHVGTEAALFEGHDLVDVDEAAPYPAKPRYLYSETKAEAEKRVLAAARDGLETLSIRPRLVWGPRDTSVLPAIVRMAKAGQFAWLDGGRARTSTTHVANLTHALELALSRGVSGRAYFVADDDERTLRSFLGALARTQGVDLGTRSMPSSIARPLARAIEGVYRLLRVRRAPPLTRFAVDMMSSSITVRTDRARRELGYAPVIRVEDGLATLAAQ